MLIFRHIYCMSGVDSKDLRGMTEFGAVFVVWWCLKEWGGVRRMEKKGCRLKKY